MAIIRAQVFDDLKQMNDEWQAWQGVVGQFKRLEIDINQERYNPLVRAIELWGEELARLRRKQPLEICDKAYSEKAKAAV